MKSPAFQFYVRDWLCSPTVRDLHRRRDRSVGAYLFLLSESWLQVPPATLPDNPEILAELARVSRQEFDEFWPALSSQFVSDGAGRLYNPRLMQAYMLQRRNFENGCKGGRPSHKTQTKTQTETQTRTDLPGRVVEDADADAEEEAESMGTQL